MTADKLQSPIQFGEELKKRKITRRQALKDAGLLGLGLAVGGVPTALRAAGGELTVVAWGGETQEIQREVMFKPFAEETGIKVIDTSTPNVAKIKAQVDTGNVEWDCVYTSLNYFYNLGPQYFEPIDYSLWPKEQIDAFPKESLTEYSVGGTLFSIVNTYRTDVFPTGQHPKNWAEFFDAELFPGPRAIYASSNLISHTTEHALQAAGLAPDEVYPLTDEKIDLAFSVLDKIKPHVVSWYAASASGIQLLANMEVVMGNFSNGRGYALAQSGLPVGIEWQGGTVNADNWLILKGTRNLEGAQRFIQFASTAEKQAALTSRVPNGPANLKALDLLDKEWAMNLPSAHLDKQVFLDLKWWSEHQQEMIQRYLEWVSK